ncbi:MAG: PGPGW domain-containing protein [Microbacteriaceae bacterium]
MSTGLAAEIDRGRIPHRGIRVFLGRLRAWVERHPKVRLGYRLFVGLFGGLIIMLGLILVPLPGPGWLIVFVGLGILGTEFPSARRVSDALKRVLMAFWSWLQHRRAERQARRSRTESNAFQIQD